MAVNKGEPALVKALDDEIQRLIAGGELNTISLQWLKKPLVTQDLVEP
jgi:ABC-type amino acid transport substrate-binding protein